jgi:hypothetical protein
MLHERERERSYYNFRNCCLSLYKERQRRLRTMRLMIFNTIYKFDINLTNNLLIMVEGSDLYSLILLSWHDPNLTLNIMIDNF